MSKSWGLITLLLSNIAYSLCLAFTFPNSAKSSSPTLSIINITQGVNFSYLMSVGLVVSDQ